MADESQNDVSGNKEPISEARARSLANLKPFQPGQSGNPSGRPRKKWLTEVMEEMLEEKLSDPAFREVYKDQVWKTMLSGKVVGAMMHEKIWDRTEGKLTTPIDVSGSIDIGEIIEKFRNK